MSDEPKVEPWMERAAEDLCPISEVTPLYIRAEIQDRQTDVAAIIAKHAAEPQPIRRGDVVQMIDSGWSATGVVIRDPQPDWIQMQSYGGSGHNIASPEHCVRIGRARYYPDGTPVED